MRFSNQTLTFRKNRILRGTTRYGPTMKGSNSLYLFCFYRQISPDKSRGATPRRIEYQGAMSM